MPFIGFFGQKSWSDLPFLPPMDHILSELSTMSELSTCLGWLWMAWHGITQSFIELCKSLMQDKALIHEGAYSKCQGPKKQNWCFGGWPVFLRVCFSSGAQSILWSSFLLLGWMLPILIDFCSDKLLKILIFFSLSVNSSGVRRMNWAKRTSAAQTRILGCLLRFWAHCSPTASGSGEQVLLKF